MRWLADNQIGERVAFAIGRCQTEEGARAVSWTNVIL